METCASTTMLDFILFKKTKEDKELCKLKDFIRFLKFTGNKIPHRFSFVESHGQLLNNLTLRENIILESIPTTLSSKNNEIQLANHIKRTGNVYLMRLFNKLSLLDVYPNKIDDQSRKIVALIQGLLKKSDFLLFQFPEKHLQSDVVDLFIQALNFQRSSTNQTIIVHSNHEDIWLPYANKIVQKNGYSFDVENIATDNTKEKLLPSTENNIICYPTEKSKAA